MKYLLLGAVVYFFAFPFVFAADLTLANQALCQHQSLDEVYKLSLNGKEQAQYKSLVKLLQRKQALEAEGSQVFKAFVACLAKFKENRPEFELSANLIDRGDIQIQYADGETLVFRPSSLKKLPKKIRKLEKKLGISSQGEKDIFWFLWVESAIAATGEKFNYYVYADQMEYEQFISDGKSFAVGFSPKNNSEKIIVDTVADKTLLDAGLTPGMEIRKISSTSVEVKNKYSWWLQQAPFLYTLEYVFGDELKVIQAKSIPFKAREFTADYWGEIAYIRINSFNGRSSIEMSRFMREVSDNAKGILLDLRFNGGGVVSPTIVDYFFKPSQEVMAFKHLQEETVHIPGSVAYTDLPVAVLQNRYSASMSEVLSAAIKSQKRGKIIGEKSFGKGVGQTMYPIKEEGVVAVVETQFFYPGGIKSWHQKGIQPDVLVEVSEMDMNYLVSHLFAEKIDLNEAVLFDRALSIAKDVLTKQMAEH